MIQVGGYLRFFWNILALMCLRRTFPEHLKSRSVNARSISLKAIKKTCRRYWHNNLVPRLKRCRIRDMLYITDTQYTEFDLTHTRGKRVKVSNRWIKEMGMRNRSGRPVSKGRAAVRENGMTKGLKKKMRKKIIIQNVNLTH